MELLGRHLKPVELVHEAVLFEPGDIVDRVYFPHTGIISLVIALSSGELIEAAMIGRDSMLGGSAAMDGLISLNKAIVQIGGTGEALEVGRFRDVADKRPDFERHFSVMSRRYWRKLSNPLHVMPCTR